MPPTVAAPSYRNISSTQRAPIVGTRMLFDLTHVRPILSPLDQFINNTASINVLFVPYTQPGMSLPRTLGFLITLGYMSAVESYFRALIRGIINIDEHSRRLVEPRNLSFAAAIHHESDMMPEAFLEDISFASVDRLKEAFKDLIGIKGQYPPDYNSQLAEFKKICELRHCCVHRFGQLGAKNAVSLGLEVHKDLLEKPFAPTVSNVQDISDMLRTFVMSSNNFIFRSILERSAKNKDDRGQPLYATNWQWNFVKDRRRFKMYYDFFATKLSNQPSAEVTAVYNDFRLENKR